tara:strand:- start:1282 stop:2355 length:1074 start_codon:yes stop_codon:yes gene_type:complete
MKICFFSVGFAFNRLIRLRFYKKIFPKNTEIFLFTTTKYNDFKNWEDNGIKIHVQKYNPILMPFKFRKFCKKNKIDRVSNLGHPFGAIPLITSSIFQDRKVLLYFLGDSIDFPKIDTFTKLSLKSLFYLLPYMLLVRLSNKVAFVGKNSYKKAPLFFLSKKSKFHYLHAPVSTDIFSPQDKLNSRKSLNLNPDKKLILYVGRITSRKGCNLLSKIIKSNPDIDFLLIGKWAESEVPRFKSSNLTHLEKIQNKDLAKYYSVADLVFTYHRQGCQMGIVGGESLACGTPILHTNRIAFPDSSAIIKVSDNINEINYKIKEFFSIPKLKRKELSNISRKYAIKYNSDQAWKNKYLDFFIK